MRAAHLHAVIPSANGDPSALEPQTTGNSCLWSMALRSEVGGSAQSYCEAKIQYRTLGLSTQLLLQAVDLNPLAYNHSCTTVSI